MNAETRGMELPEMALWTGRLNTSLTWVLSAVVSSFCQVKAYCAYNPCHSRMVALACSALYQTLPFGAQFTAMLVNCGYGWRDCASEDACGKPAYGTLKPAACGLPEAKVDDRSDQFSVYDQKANCAWMTAHPEVDGASTGQILPDAVV